MKIFLAACRVIVGTLFVISGLIKANDPSGFSYKLEEYFTVFSTDLGTVKKEVPAEIDEKIKNSPCFSKLNIPKQYEQEAIPRGQLGFFKRSLIDLFGFMGENALFLAVLICIIEIILGLFTIVGYRMRLVAWLLFLMIVFFTFLTFYSAYYNKVTDCGCFGDALKLTPWQSFSKDIFLLAFILPLFIWQRRINGIPLNRYEIGISVSSLVLMTILCTVQFKWLFPVWFLAVFVIVRIALARRFSPVQQEMLNLLLVLIASTWFTVYCISHLSVRDYRPWRNGNNVRELTQYTPEVAEIVMVYLDNSTCEEKKMPTTDWSWLDSTFEATHTFYKQDKKVIKPAIEPKVKDFTLEDPNTGETHGEEFINFPGYAFLWIAPKLEKASLRHMDRINAIAEYAMGNNMMFAGATSSTSDVIDKFRHDNQNMFPIYQNDEKALKTILRSNPGLVLIRDGVVVNKWHYNDFPKAETIREKYR